jgi:hypothetical protein
MSTASIDEKEGDEENKKDIVFMNWHMTVLSTFLPFPARRPSRLPSQEGVLPP